MDKAAMLRPMVPMTGTVPDCLADMPPLGCGQDAYKLFVGNVPKHLTEDDLLPIFSTVGGALGAAAWSFGSKQFCMQG
jgi:hypothetical protein